MNKGKIIIDGIETEFSLGIEEEAVERNEEFTNDTIDLKNIVKEINGES